MKSDRISIGIDLGTSKCCMAVVHSGIVEVIENEKNCRTTPSYVAFTKDGRVVGEDAKNQFGLNPSNTFYGIKKLMGVVSPSEGNIKKFSPLYTVNYSTTGIPNVKSKYKNHDRSLQPKQLTTMLLGKLKTLVEEKFSCKAGEAVISVPSCFNTFQRQATLDAGKIAGFDKVHLINETTAVGIAYSDHLTHSSATRMVLIVDFGGGFLTLALTQIGPQSVDVKAVKGQMVGGEELTSHLVDICFEHIKKQHPKIDDEGKLKARLLIACEKAKLSLSLLRDTNIFLDNVMSGELNLKVSQHQFTVRWYDEIKTVFSTLLQDVIKISKIDLASIDELLVVGGSTRIPKFQEILKEQLPNARLSKSVNADEAVAVGAALQAAHISKDIYTRSIDVTEALHNTFVAKFINSSNSKKSKLFNLNNCYSDKRIVCSLQKSEVNAKSSFTVSEKTSDGCIWEIGKINFPNIASQQFKKMEVIFLTDENGILSCSTTQHTNKQKCVIDTTQKWHAIKPIENICKKEKTFQTDEKREEENIHKSVELESLCFNVRSKVGDSNAALKEEATEILDWLSIANKPTLKKLESKYVKLSEQFEKYLSSCSTSKLIESAPVNSKERCYNKRHNEVITAGRLNGIGSNATREVTNLSNDTSGHRMVGDQSASNSVNGMDTSLASERNDMSSNSVGVTLVRRKLHDINDFIQSLINQQEYNTLDEKLIDSISGLVAISRTCSSTHNESVDVNLTLI